MYNVSEETKFDLKCFTFNWSLELLNMSPLNNIKFQGVNITVGNPQFSLCSNGKRFELVDGPDCQVCSSI